MGAVPTGVEGLLKNFALLDIVNDTPKENVGSNIGSHDCEACGEKHPANFCCLDCKENMCKTAAQFHTRNTASRDHQVVSLEELEANPQLASVSLICQKHNDEFVGNTSLLNTLVTCVYHLLKRPPSMERK